MPVNINSPEGLFDSSHKFFRLYNAYSVASGHTRSVAPLDLFPLHVFPTLVVGDLDIHHSLSDPERILTNNESHISAPYFTKASDNLFFSSVRLRSSPGFHLPPPTDQASSIWPLQILPFYCFSPPGIPHSPPLALTILL